MSLKQLVTDYNETYGKNLDTLAKAFAKLAKRGLDEAVERAALGLCPGDREKMHPHQCRVGREKLAAAWQKNGESLKSGVRQSKNFAGLHTHVCNMMNGCKRIGPVCRYDIALRIGYSLGLSFRPKVVYLHAGTREGARTLGYDVKSGSLKPEDMKRLGSLLNLAPHHIENFLCIYKGKLRQVQRRQNPLRTSHKEVSR